MAGHDDHVVGAGCLGDALRGRSVANFGDDLGRTEALERFDRLVEGFARFGLEPRGFAVTPDLQAGTGGGRLRLGRGQPGQLDDEARERGGARRVGQCGIKLGKPGVDGGTQRVELALCRFEQMDVS